MTDHRQLAAYDAGLLSDYGAGNVEWWHDYIRAELGRAHEFYQAQIDRPPGDASAEIHPYCPWCSKSVFPGEPTAVVDGERFHLSCAAEEADEATFDRDMGFS